MALRRFEKKLFRLLCAVPGTALPAIRNAGCIKRAADDVVTHAGQVLYAAAANQDNGVFTSRLWPSPGM